MKDISVILKNYPGALAEMGFVLGNAGISLEGGGVFLCNGVGVGHFLVEDAEKAKKVLEENYIETGEINMVLIQRLKQEVPGQLGKICRIMGENNINIKVQYSDHSNNLILVVDDYIKGKVISENWIKGMYD
jgi:hypothetical protein